MILKLLHLMGVKILFVLFFFFLKTSADAWGPHCKPVRCSEGGPAISFPFYLRGQPQDCGVPGFGLICRSNTTMIKLPSHGELVVKSISYRDRELDLLDPRNCVQEVFLNLNLSHTPFMYFYSLNSYNYINCSRPVVPQKYSSPEIPCLSGPGYHVYSVGNSPFSVAANQYRSSSCWVVKTVEIPFPYSPYLSDSSFGLRLNWESTGSCKTCTGIGNRGGEGGLLINQTTTALSITIVILFIMAVVMRVKIHKYMGRDENAINAEKLLDDGQSRTITAG